MFNKNEIGLYIHIPFCKSKCFYCDFNSFEDKDELIPEYFKTLIAELKYYKNKLDGFKIMTIFIGGGTPSLVDTKYIYEIINYCKNNFKIDETAEITIETNPGTLNSEKLQAYYNMGINRLSIGLQAWQNDLLHKLGRIHKINDFLENYKEARNAGFSNINIDLIFGLPTQTLENWEETLENVLKLNPEHISCYSLKIEEGTIFGKNLDNGQLQQIDDELDREMYYITKKKLEKAKIMHYEISNFSKSGFECKHNLVYWKQEEYVGVGAGAHSFLEGKRFNNIYDIKKYNCIDFTKEWHREEVHTIDKSGAMSEFVILGLRLIDGISKVEFFEKFNCDLMDIFGQQIKLLINKKFIVIEGNNIKLTDLGLDLANSVFVEFV